MVYVSVFCHKYNYVLSWSVSRTPSYTNKYFDDNDDNDDDDYDRINLTFLK